MKRLALTVTVFLLVGVALSGVASAGDMPVIVQIEPSETEASAGDTVELDIVVTTDGGYGDIGVESIEMFLGHGDGLRATEAERGEWFETDGPDDAISFDYSVEDNGITLEQRRDDGATGMDETYATVMFEVLDGAEGEQVLYLDSINSTLTNDLLQPTVGHNATVNVTASDEVKDAGDEAERMPGFGAVGAVIALFVVVSFRRSS